MSFRVACVGGGPGGLLFATLLKQHDPNAEVIVFERNQPLDAFGFGVVFSDSTLSAIDTADPALRDGLREYGHHWDRIQVWNRGERIGFDGNGMTAIHRRALLPLLHDRARKAGVELRFGANVSDISELDDFDVIVGADGANSMVRASVEERIGHSVETATAKFIWFGTSHMFDGLTFVHRQSEFGAFAAHAYPISDEISTFIVEADEATWKAAGLDEFDVTQPPGLSDEKSRLFVKQLFAEDLGGAEVVANNSRWASFRTRRSEKWHSGKVVLLGDAVHTAHFSVGSGTKMAMEDGIVLARELTAGHATLEDAFLAYEAERQPSVRRIQDAARGGLGWWEHFGLYSEKLEPLQFAFHFFSRSINIDRIEPRDPELVASMRARWGAVHGAAALDTQLQVGDHRWNSRLLFWNGKGFAETKEGPFLEITELGVLQLPTAPLQSGVDAELAGTVLSGTVLVTDGTPFDRVRVSEELRLGREICTILAISPDEPLDPETLVLSGRADAVAVFTPGASND